MSKTAKVVGKLSFWGMLLAFLIWLGKQLLAYLLALIMPWLNWLLGWIMLILGIAVFAGVVISGTLAFLWFRSWKRKREEKKKSTDDQA